jgi:hypothetical protein
MTTWREFVKEVQAKNKISYKEALKKASPLWAKQKSKKTKKTSKKKKAEPLKEPEEVVDFPKQVEKKKKKMVRRRVPPTITQLNMRGKKKMERLNKVRKRLAKKHSILVDHEAKQTAKLSGL